MPAEAGCDRGDQLMQIALATVGEPATPPRQMRHSFQPTARSPRGSRELPLGLANPSGRLGAEPRIGDGFAGRQRRKPLHAPVNPDQVAGFLAHRVHVRHLNLERDARDATFLGERAGADRCMVRQQPVQIKLKPPGHAFEDQSTIGQSDPAKFADAEPATCASI
jgi:hypothetical protein